MNGLLHSSKIFCKRNASTILTCLGGVGVIATSIAAVTATPKALQILNEAKKEKGEDLTNIEKIKMAGPKYVPSILLGAGTIFCIFGANVMSKRNQAALVSAYTLIDNSYKEYRQKLKELYGEEMHQEIIDAIAAEKAENVGIDAPGFVSNGSLYVDEQCGEYRLFYEEYGDRFFEATLEQVISAEYHLNRNYTLRGYSVLNELYDFLGLENTDYGDQVGWANYDDGMAWIDFNHRQTEICGKRCIMIDMPFAPELEWQEYY